MYRLQASVNNRFDFNFKQDTEFCVNEAGHYRLITQNHYQMIRPNGRNDYQLIYVADGQAWFVVDGTDVLAKPGGFLIYSPNAPQNYHYYLNDNPDIYWVHFGGYHAARLLEQLNLKTDCVLSSQLNNSIIRRWLQMIRELTLKQNGFETLVPVCCIEILTLISREMTPLNTIELRSQKTILDAMEYISNEMSRSLSIQELARHLGVSVSWLNLKFKSYTGMSPMQYIINFKVSRAQELLHTTDLSITEIAQMCGYDDPLYFSRIFHKHTKTSPREFRKKTALLEETDNNLK